MAKISLIQNEKTENSIEQIKLDNVTLKMFGRDAILQSIELSLPLDETVVIESSNPQNAVYFLQFLAGRLVCESGQILCNGENIFSSDNDINPQDIIASFFENYFCDKNLTVEALFRQTNFDFENYDVISYFEMDNYKKTKIKDLSYEVQKVVFLIYTVLNCAEVLVLEDPAMGISEFYWLQFLDLMQYQQRQGGLRHIYLTNNHPTAMRHLAYNKLFLEDGLVYFDENAGYKKASHF